MRCSVNSGRRAKGAVYFSNENRLRFKSRYLCGQELINSLKSSEWASGYFSVGYAAFVAIDGREVEYLIVEQRYVQMGETDATVGMDMSIEVCDNH